MNRRSARVATRALAMVGAATLIAAVPSPAQADTEYDGEATALSSTGLTLTLFPADQKLPAPFNQISRPEEQVIELSPDQLGLPSRFGHAEFPGVDEPGSLPSNPLVNGGAFRAASTRVGDTVVSEAIIGHLDIGGGALTLEDIVARCTGNGSQITVDAPLVAVGGHTPVQGALELEPDTSTPIPGVGSITWNDQVTDGATYGEVTNLILDLQTDLDADVLQQLPEAMKAFEDVVQQLLTDLKNEGAAATGLEIPGNPQDVTGEQLYYLLDDVLAQLPTDQLPELNPLLELSGSVTLASAACSQQVGPEPVQHNPPKSDNQPPEQPPAGDRSKVPPLADTGVSPWPLRAGVAGLLAVVAGGFLVLRQRRGSS